MSCVTHLPEEVLHVEERVNSMVLNCDKWALINNSFHLHWVIYWQQFLPLRILGWKYKEVLKFFLWCWLGWFHCHNVWDLVSRKEAAVSFPELSTWIVPGNAVTPLGMIWDKMAFVVPGLLSIYSPKKGEQKLKSCMETAFVGWSLKCHIQCVSALKKVWPRASSKDQTMGKWRREQRTYDCE